MLLQNVMFIEMKLSFVFQKTEKNVRQIVIEFNWWAHPDFNKKNVTSVI